MKHTFSSLSMNAFLRSGRCDTAATGVAGRNATVKPTRSVLLLVLALLAVAVGPAMAVDVQIQSQYGPERVYPPVTRSGNFPAGQQIIFSAPKYIYLDRDRHELDPSEANIRDRAFYRAVNVGLTIDGGNVQLSGDNTFIETLTNDMTVVWLWDLEYAVIVESATASVDGLEESLGNPAIGGSASPIGKHWYAADTIISASIDGIITPANSPEQDTRFSTRGYVIENAPGQVDHFLEFNGLNSFMTVPSVRFQPFGDFTIEFWARHEPGETTNQQEIVRFINDPQLSLNTFPLLRVGLEPSEGSSNTNGMFLATNGVDGIVAELPGAYVDNAWHHWAWTHEADTDTLRCFRDSQVVPMECPIHFIP